MLMASSNADILALFRLRTRDPILLLRGDDGLSAGASIRISPSSLLLLLRMLVDSPLRLVLLPLLVLLLLVRLESLLFVLLRVLFESLLLVRVRVRLESLLLVRARVLLESLLLVRVRLRYCLPSPPIVSFDRPLVWLSSLLGDGKGTDFCRRGSRLDRLLVLLLDEFDTRETILALLLLDGET